MSTISSTRARRSTVKKIDYAKEQEFSDEDLFGDESSPDEAVLKKVRRSKKSTGVRRQAAMSADEDVDDYAGGESKMVYTEMDYDPMLPPIRERFPFLPEYEEDGSPKIELIVGRRPVDEKEEVNSDDDGEDAEDATATKPKPPASPGGDESDDDGKKSRKRKTRRSSKTKSPKTPSPTKKTNNEEPENVEYEYLVKYKGRSYLHLEWKTGADLESMNKSAKGMYRRYLKKIAAGTDDDLESPDFDPSYVVPEKIVDEKDQEFQIELTDKELLKWEKEREKELAKEEGDDDDDDDDEKEEEETGDKMAVDEEEEKKEEIQPIAEEAVNGYEKKETEDDVDWKADEIIDFSNLRLERLRAILAKDGPYYPVIKGSDNPYRDGYVKEPPKKPRASYLFYQASMRSYFQKKNPSASQSELMAILGEAWRNMAEQDKAPFQVLADEEAKQYEKERVLLEKAQKPNGVWQPLRRCKKVLERLSKDSFAEIFLEPVDTEEFPDYTEVIDAMMDLGTVKEKLETKKYQAPEQFARDMRRIWNNCKIYNQHGSAIWHVADYMSKQFERLYHAWVLEFRERYLRWAEPRARPWEHSCRVHDGKCETPDNEMVLCDHCDAMYGFRCVNLKKVPKKAWHCPDCKPKLKTPKGLRMYSAVAENAARKRAELGDLPKKKLMQKMFLVKWAGLGYEFCTWETKADIANDSLIAEFQKLNKGYSDEPDMPEEVIDKFLEGIKHVNIENAGGSDITPHLRSQFYAQSRAFQFAKFGNDLPDNVGFEVGPKTTAVVQCPRFSQLGKENLPDSELQKHPREVVECLADVVFKVSRNEQPRRTRQNTSLPPLLTGEYDQVLPITSKGLMMNVGEIHGSVAFLGYRQFEDGSKGPAERANLIRNVGDKIIAVDGVSTIGKSFKDVIMLLKESGKNKFAYMRFLETRFSVCDIAYASAGTKGRYAYEELRKKFTVDRQRFIVQRKTTDAEEQLQQTGALDSVSAEKDSDAESEDEGSEGEFEPESEDEELVGTISTREVSPSEKRQLSAETDTATDAAAAGEKQEGAVSDTQQQPSDRVDGLPAPEEAVLSAPGISSREETTRSLALRLLDADVGYSSDEAGEEECAYFLDGVDDTFTRMNDVEDLTTKKRRKTGDKKKSDELEKATIPANRQEFSSQGSRGKLAAAMALTSKPPSLEDFDNFPHPSTKDIEAQEKEEADKHEEVAIGESPTKSTKRSTVKVEQVDVSTGEIIHVWANVESAAATLQLPLPQLRQVLTGEYDEVIGEEVGGFKWRYALAGAKVTAGQSASRGGGGKKAKEAWLEFRDKLYDPSEPHIYKNGNRLRDYQVDGVNWLASTWYKRQGCILADEMGLGKTVQIVCYIEHLFRVEKIHRPFLVVVPLSTVEHWRREFEGWTDLVCCIYHDRQRVWRDVLREYEWYYEDRPHTSDFLKFDVLVTTYDTLIGDFDVISQIPFRVAVVDEAHRLRNQRGKLLECMREISAKGTMQYGFQSRVLMSGTPLQNDLTELWTLLNFIEPFNFPDLDDFQASFGNMASRSEVEALQKMISPFMLRRVKEDVAKDIPAKEETVIDVELTSIQKQYYRAIFEHNHAFLSMGASRQSAPKLMNIQMELRKVCNHPFLLEGVEHRETDRQFKEFLEKGAFDGKSPEEQHQMLNEHGYIMTSGKMVLMDKLLPKLRQEGHKILIFSQMVRMLDLISEYCEFRGFRFERLDGRVRGTERQKAIDRFEREDDSFLFLLSTRAGGVGINLTAADIVVIFDSDWNPQNDIQAQARCHRIGQTKDVRIYRLVTSRSFEQEMFDRASKKLGLEQAVLGTFEKDKEDDKPSQQEMEQLLKKGAYALLEDENDEITNDFCADDIDSILAKRTRTRVVEGAKTASWLNKQGMVVSKSKFTAETGESLDLEDPMFWQKVMPDFVTPSIMLQKLNDLQDEIDGKKRGPGRGRGRRKKKAPEEENKESEAKVDDSEALGSEAKAKEPEAGVKEGGDEGPDQSVETKEESADVDALLSTETLEELSEDEIDDKKSKSTKAELSRKHIRSINKFMNDLKSMMESILEEEDEEGLSGDEKDACQKLLLTISVKEKMFDEDQRRLARKFLKHLEGDRRRRCRTSEQPRFQPGAMDDEEQGSAVREELMIRSKKKKKRKKRIEAVEDEEPLRKKRKQSTENGGYLGEDGYLHHSDSEGEWSEVGESIYETGKKKKDTISRKEANRRRHWAADDDAATAAGRAWPVFPRHVVKKVLSSLLDEVLKYDEERGGVFSVPVPKDEFPEYYEQIKKPMDYGTMKMKLENGEYRSAQAMQKDFILILQNCRQFNATSSEIVQEARQQHMLRPRILKDAAAKHNLFLAEDGSVLEIVDDEKSPKKKGKKKKKKAGEDEEGAATPKKGKGKKTGDKSGEDAGEAEETPTKKKKKGKKKKVKDQTGEEAAEAVGEEESSKKVPRIRIKVKAGADGEAKEKKKAAKRKRKSEADDAGEGPDFGDVASAKIPKKRKKDDDQPAKKRHGKKKDKASTRVFLDLPLWTKHRESLDGSFDAARANFTREGPWAIPDGLPVNSFSEVAKWTLSTMNKYDEYSLFKRPVSDKEAPGYSETITNPMDFGTMREKVDSGVYGGGSEAAAAFYDDFLLVFDNCRLYNTDESDVTEEAARIFGLVPEAYVSACIKEENKMKSLSP